MAGRITASEEQLKPDPKFGDLVLARFINCMMLGGNKATATRIIYSAFEEIHNLQLRYDGFSLIQRKNTKRRDETVNLVEDNVLATISAMTAVSPMLPSLGGEEEEEG